MVGRHVHDEDVADAAAGAQPGLARDDRAEQLVGVQAALHQQLGLALRAPARPPWPPTRGCAARRRSRVSPRSMPLRLRRSPGSSPPGRRGSARSGPSRAASIAPASAVSSHGCATAVGTGSRLRQRSSSCSYFPVPVCLSHECLAHVTRDRRASRRARFPSGRTSSTIASADAVQQRLERRLVVLERHRRRAAADARSAARPNTGPSSALKVKFRKLTTPVAVPLELAAGWLP